jgi:hypothetical protein
VNPSQFCFDHPAQ